MTSPAGAVQVQEEDLPVAQVSERTSGVSVTWCDEGTTQPNNNSYLTYFVARKANGNEPTFKEFGSLLHCNGGTLTTQKTKYRIRVISTKPAHKAAHRNWEIELKENGWAVAGTQLKKADTMGDIYDDLGILRDDSKENRKLQTQLRAYILEQQEHYGVASAILIDSNDQSHKQRMTPQSPAGEALELAVQSCRGATQGTLLAADAFCRSKIPFGIQHPEDIYRRPELGRFTKQKFPHTRGVIDTRLGLGESWETTPVGKELSDYLDKDYAVYVLLLGKSGCGKTSAIFDAGHNKFCILVTASNGKPQEQADPAAHDPVFTDLYVRVGAIIGEDISLRKRDNKCQHHILAFLLARMLMLRTFRTFNPSAKPEAWLIYQLTQDHNQHAEILFRSLIDRPYLVLLDLRAALKQEMDFFFAFDEVQLGYEMYEEDGLWKSSTKKNLGLASPIIQHMATITTLVIAGTALSLARVDSCSSGIGKNRSIKVFQQFPPVPLQEMEAKLDSILDMSDVDVGASSLAELEGRGRNFGGLFAVLARVIQLNPQADKNDQFCAAVEEHFLASLERIKERISNAYYGEKDLLLKPGKRLMPRGLELLAIASMFGGTVSISHHIFGKDLLHSGLCSIRKLTGKDDEFVLDEELARRAILDIAQENSFATKTFQEVSSFCAPATGHAMEPLIVAELRHWCIRKSKSLGRPVLVNDFLSAACKKLPSNLPSWVKTTCFSVMGGYNKRNYKAKGVADDVEFVKKAINDPVYRNRMLSPSTVKRPDYEAVMEARSRVFVARNQWHWSWPKQLGFKRKRTQEADEPEESESLWFLSVSSKLCSSTYDDTSRNDFRSTDPQKFYRKKDGSENKQCRNLRQRWEGLLGANEDIFKRCLRIHFCLPEVKRGADDGKRILVHGDSIVLYITSKNIRRFFRSQTVETLRQLGCLKDEG